MAHLVSHHTSLGSINTVGVGQDVSFLTMVIEWAQRCIVRDCVFDLRQRCLMILTLLKDVTSLVLKRLFCPMVGWDVCISDSDLHRLIVPWYAHVKATIVVFIAAFSSEILKKVRLAFGIRREFLTSTRQVQRFGHLFSCWHLISAWYFFANFADFAQTWAWSEKVADVCSIPLTTLLLQFFLHTYYCGLSDIN